MSAHDEQLGRQFRRRAQDRRRRRAIAKQAAAFGLEAMHALIKPLLPELSHSVAEIYRRHAIAKEYHGAGSSDDACGSRATRQNLLASGTKYYLSRLLG